MTGMPSHKLTGTWNEVFPDGMGYGTYHTTMVLPQPAGAYTDLSIRLARIKTAYRLYVNDQYIGGRGSPGETKEQTRFQYFPAIMSIDRALGDTDTTVDVRLHVANWDYHKGGIDNTVYIDEFKALEREWRIGLIWLVFIAGALTSLGLYHLLIGSMIKSIRTESLIYAVYTLLMGARLWATGEKPYSLVFPDWAPELWLKMEVMSAAVGMPLIIPLVYAALKTTLTATSTRRQLILHKLAVFTALLCSGLSLIIGIFFDVAATGRSIYILDAAVVLSIIYVNATAVQLMRLHGHTTEQLRYGTVLTFCAIILTGASLNDMLFEMGIIQTGYQLHYAILALAIAIGLIISSRMSWLAVWAQQRNEELDAAVDNKTEQLQESLAVNVSLAARLQASIEDERRAISDEIHDGFTSQLSGMKLGISGISGALARKDDPDVKRAAESLASIADLMDQTYNSVRAIVHQIRPEAMEINGLEVAIKDLSRTYPHLDLIVNISADIQLDRPAEMALYRLTQECLANTIRHSDADRACIHLTRNQESLTYTYRDNGGGLPEGYTPGIGIFSMRHRATSINGRLELANYSDGALKGVSVSCTFKDPAVTQSIQPE